MVETDTISAIYAHVSSSRLSSIIPHTWLHGFGIPEGTRVVPLPRPSRSFHVGLVLAGRGPESLLAQAFIETARKVDLRPELDGAARRHR